MHPYPQRPVVLISQQLGWFDGMSVVAATWQELLEELGCSVRRAAGFIHDAANGDLVLPSLW